MAEKQEKKPEAAAPAADKAGHDTAKKGGMLTKTPVLIGGVMLIEAAVLFAGFKFLGGGPDPADGAHLETGTSATDENASGALGVNAVEVSVVDFTALNTVSGRKLRVDVTIFAVTTAEHEQRVKDTIKSREALIKDRIRTIIAQSDPEKLGGGAEPGLETLRRQIKYQLDEIIGDGIIDEVLVPRCIPIRVEF